jgi:hypothetical protein
VTYQTPTSMVPLSSSAMARLRFVKGTLMFVFVTLYYRRAVSFCLEGRAFSTPSLTCICRNFLFTVPRLGSTSVLDHTFGVDEDDVLLLVPAGSGSCSSSLNLAAPRRAGGGDGELQRSFAKRAGEEEELRAARV